MQYVNVTCTILMFNMVTVHGVYMYEMMCMLRSTLNLELKPDPPRRARIVVGALLVVYWMISMSIYGIFMETGFWSLCCWFTGSVVRLCAVVCLYVFNLCPFTGSAVCLYVVISYWCTGSAVCLYVVIILVYWISSMSICGNFILVYWISSMSTCGNFMETGLTSHCCCGVLHQ